MSLLKCTGCCTDCNDESPTGNGALLSRLSHCFHNRQQHFSASRYARFCKPQCRWNPRKKAVLLFSQLIFVELYLPQPIELEHPDLNFTPRSSKQRQQDKLLCQFASFLQDCVVQLRKVDDEDARDCPLRFLCGYGCFSQLQCDNNQLHFGQPCQVKHAVNKPIWSAWVTVAFPQTSAWHPPAAHNFHCPVVVPRILRESSIVCLPSLSVACQCFHSSFHFLFHYPSLYNPNIWGLNGAGEVAASSGEPFALFATRGLHGADCQGPR